MILETVSCEAEEYVDEPIVPNDSQESLFVVEPVKLDELWSRVWDTNAN